MYYICTMTKKQQARLAELKKEERVLFDTYKTRKSKVERAEHLERMAACIREQMEYEK